MVDSDASVSGVLEKLHKLSIVDDSKVEPFLHTCVDILCGREHGLEAFGKVGEVGEVAEMCTNYIKSIVRSYQGKEVEEAKVVQQLASGNVTESMAKTIYTVVVARRDEIEERLKQQASQLFPRHLKDFDWSVRLITSSDHISSTKKAVMMLTLTTQNETTGNAEDVTVELSREDLDSLLENCNDINGVIQELRV